MPAVHALALLLLALTALSAEPVVVADFGQPDELGRWRLGNSGPQSQVERVPGPDGKSAVQVTCVAEPQLAPQAHSPSPYLPFQRAVVAAPAVAAKATRVSFWHRGVAMQLVLLDTRGGAWYRTVDASPDWRRVAVPLNELAHGWGDAGGGQLALADVNALHFGLAVKPGARVTYAVAEVAFERHTDDLDPFEFIGGTQPAKVALYPQTLGVPLNRVQLLLVEVTNEAGCGLPNVPVELDMQGIGAVATHGGGLGHRPARELKLVTDEDGHAHARYLPRGQVGESAVLTVRLPGTPTVPSATARLTNAAPMEKPSLGRDGFFHRPDGQPLMLLGGLFMPWWYQVKDGRPGAMQPGSIIGASEAEQRAWFAYLRSQGVNCIRGYWPWGQPLKLGPGGAVVRPEFCVDGHVNEPVISALERTMALGGEYGLGFTLTILDCARPFIAPGGRLPAGVSRRRLTSEVFSYLREIVPRLGQNPNVWGFELTNEQSWGVFDYSQRLIRGIQDLDLDTPVMVSHWGGGLQTADPLVWMQRTGIDIYQPHVYPDTGHSIWGPTVDSGLLQDVHYNAMRGTKPWLLGESGGYNTHPPLGALNDDVAEAYLARDCLWFALLNRANGAFLWGHRNAATPEFRAAAAIAPTIDWAALAKANAPVGVGVPRPLHGDLYFRSEAGKRALAVMTEYARWSLRAGVPVDFPLNNEAYAVRCSAEEPFAAPKVDAPFSVAPGYELKVRLSADGKLAVGYLRNVAEIKLHKPETPKGWTWKVTGSHIRVRRPATARVSWQLPAARYRLAVYDLDQPGNPVAAVSNAPATSRGDWQQTTTEHDYVLVWRAEE